MSGSSQSSFTKPVFSYKGFIYTLFTYFIHKFTNKLTSSHDRYVLYTIPSF